MVHHLYQIFGLVIDSECECPELVAAAVQSVPDVWVRWGDVPQHLEHSVTRGNWLEASSREMLLKIAEHAFYWVKDGKEIVIQPDKQASPENIRLFLLGSAMGAILHQRGILPFHGSSVVVGGKAFVFSGQPGMGKSTLAASLVKRGYQLLADDVSAIRLTESGQALVYPGMPQLKLCFDTMMALDLATADNNPLRRYFDKYGYPVHHAFNADPLPAQMICILDKHQKDDYEMVHLKGIEKFQALRIHTYRPYFPKLMGLYQVHFELLKQLASQVDVAVLSRPEKGFQIDRLTDYVESIIR